MSLTLEALEVLDAIDRNGSFAAAARELDRVPSALTYTVRRLEEELDVLLFDRRGHRAKLTPAGRELVEQGRILLNSAEALSQRVKRVASGWEAELRVAVDEIIPFARLVPLLERFYALKPPTRLRVTSEALAGCWETLVDGRADMTIGAPGDSPVTASGPDGIVSRPFGSMGFVFAVAPGHPLAAAPEPIAACDLVRHRAVAIADTSRRLPARTVGLLRGQDVLTVPTFAAKLDAQCAGLGVGHLPAFIAAEAVRQGRLVVKEVEEPRKDVQLHLAWRTGARGKALKWFLEALQAPTVAARLLGG